MPRDNSKSRENGKNHGRDLSKSKNSWQNHSINSQVRTWVWSPYSQYLVLVFNIIYTEDRKINNNMNSNWKAAPLHYSQGTRTCTLIAKQVSNKAHKMCNRNFVPNDSLWWNSKINCTLYSMKIKYSCKCSCKIKKTRKITAIDKNHSLRNFCDCMI